MHIRVVETPLKSWSKGQSHPPGHRVLLRLGGTSVSCTCSWLRTRPYNGRSQWVSPSDVVRVQTQITHPSRQRTPLSSIPSRIDTSRPRGHFVSTNSVTPPSTPPHHPLKVEKQHKTLKSYLILCVLMSSEEKIGVKKRASGENLKIT